MYKMIITDLDGTLLNEEKKASSSTKQYLKELKNKGYIICLDTGRTIKRATFAIDDPTFVNYIIANNGAYIYDVDNNKCLYKSIIKDETVKELFLSYINDFNTFEMNSDDYIYRYYLQSEPSYPYVKRVTNKDDLIKNINNIYNITIRFNNEIKTIEFLENLKNNYQDIYAFIMQDSFSNQKWITLMNKEVNKFNGIKILSNKLNIDNSEIIAFGDGLNDIEMLENVGCGVAMHNALESVKKVSKYITEFDNSNDGVIKYLKNII